MAIYVVMEPPAANAAEAAERAVFVRDGVAFFAFLVPPLWLLWHRLWIEAAIAFAVSVGLTALGETAGLGFTGGALSLLVSIFVGLEGQALRINALRRRGWSEWGVVEANDLGEAEIRYLAGDVPEAAVQSSVPHLKGPIQPRLTAGAASGPALGLFDYPGNR
ncbi:DUF2628 domain-containing protein [Mesorhizobium sp. KR9-304]|uniref:DUF2628 domain-containing protein n=1 Tax=Mesorhizobium sp. KR9-304 TaxID=3156614 RepID=UPI0032B4EEE2